MCYVFEKCIRSRFRRIEVVEVKKETKKGRKWNAVNLVFEGNDRDEERLDFWHVNFKLVSKGIETDRNDEELCLWWDEGSFDSHSRLNEHDLFPFISTRKCNLMTCTPFQLWGLFVYVNQFTFNVCEFFFFQVLQVDALANNLSLQLVQFNSSTDNINN